MALIDMGVGKMSENWEDSLWDVGSSTQVVGFILYYNVFGPRKRRPLSVSRNIQAADHESIYDKIPFLRRIDHDHVQPTASTKISARVVASCAFLITFAFTELFITVLLVACRPPTAYTPSSTVSRGPVTWYSVGMFNML